LSYNWRQLAPCSVVARRKPPCSGHDTPSFVVPFAITKRIHTAEVRGSSPLRPRRTVGQGGQTPSGRTKAHTGDDGWGGVVERSGYGSGSVRAGDAGHRDLCSSASGHVGACPASSPSSPSTKQAARNRSSRALSSRMRLFPCFSREMSSEGQKLFIPLQKKCGEPSTPRL